MKFGFRLVIALIVTTGLWVRAASAAGPDGAAAAGTIPPGTQITMQNWQNYKEFMSDGMVALFQGTYEWKMPPDIELDVGPTVIHPLPKGYLDATEKYASQAKLVDLPDGGLTLEGYVAGTPFPNPDGPHKGWEILANLWFRYTPRLTASTPENPVIDCHQDSHGNIACEKMIFIDRWLKHVTDPGYPMVDPQAGDRYETRFGMTIEPEQLKYSAGLTIYYDDLTRLPGTYTFSPAQRRVTQTSSASRCQPSAGSDMTADDFRYGFAGNITEFSADFLGERKILALLDYDIPLGRFPANYFMPLGFPKPSWGKWELRDVYEIDLRKLPAKAGGYCYGKRIMYVDKRFYAPIWEELYDSQMKYWKTVHISPQALEVPGVGLVNNAGSMSEQVLDLQNAHATYDTSFDDQGHTVYINQQAPKEYEDQRKYSTPGGLSEIMR